MPESNYMNLEATELRLGLPGSNNNQPEVRYDSSTTKNNSNKRALPEDDSVSSTNISAISDATNDNTPAPPMPKSQIVGWPPVRSYRKNNLQTVLKKPSSEGSEDVVLYVKVSMDGAPYLRKIDLKLYSCYSDLLEVLKDMFKVKIGQYSEREGYNGSDYAPTYEDKDGDWMLVGDVPWTMFVLTCKRLRIMRSSEAQGLGQTSH